MNKSFFFSKKKFNYFIFSITFYLLSICAQAQLDNPDWGDNSTSCRENSILYPGVAVATCGVLSTIPTNERYSIAYIAMGNSIPGNRSEITNTDSTLHHTDWLVQNIGNLYGVAIKQSTSEVFVAASSNYGDGLGFFNNDPAVLNYGTIGSPANDVEAAGTVYRLDPITGAASVFTVLPQQSTTLTHWNCEDDLSGQTPSRTNTGVGLGNITYDELNDQFFISNVEDGRIYRVSNTGVILDSFDPLVYDTGVAGIADIEDVPYGLAVEPGSGRLFYGLVDDPTPIPAGNPPGPNGYATPGSPSIYSIDLDASGGFVGTIDNTILPVGVPNNYVGTNTFHTIVPTAENGARSYTEHTTYFISDLTFDPNGELLVGVRVGCYGSWHSSYNHWAETDVISLNVGTNLYDTTPFEYDISVTGDAGADDGYGGVAFYETANGDIHYLATSADIIEEAGPHGIAIWDSGTTNSPLSPMGAFSYGTVSNIAGNNDPKGIGGDIEVLNRCIICTVACTITDSQNPACFGDANGSITATGTDATAYEYSLDAFATAGQTSGTFSNLAAGDYTVTVRDANDPSCLSTCTITLIEPQAVTCSTVVDSQPTCEDLNGGAATVTPAGGDNTYTYLWSSGGTSATETGLSEGTYTVVVTDGADCSETCSVEIVAPTGCCPDVICLPVDINRN